MSEKNLIDLVNAELDGELSEDQAIELENLLNDSVQARKYRKDLQEMGQLFSSLPQEELPEHFHISIDQHFPEKSGKWPSRIISNVLLWPVEFKYSMAVAGMIIILLIVNQMFVYKPVDNLSNLLGTILDKTPGNKLSTAKDEYDYPKLKGSAQLDKIDELYLLTYKIDSVDSVTVKIDFSENAVKFIGFAQQMSGIEKIIIEKDSLEFSYSGQHEFTVFLAVDDQGKLLNQTDQQPLQIHYSLISSNNILHEGILISK